LINMMSNTFIYLFVFLLQITFPIDYFSVLMFLLTLVIVLLLIIVVFMYFIMLEARKIRELLEKVS